MLAEREKARGRRCAFLSEVPAKAIFAASTIMLKLIGQESITATTLDGCHGAPGFVTKPLEAYLARIQTKNAEIFACGP